MAEFEQVVVRSSQGEATSYAASPHESAFSTTLRKKFRTALGPAYVNDYGCLTRFAHPAIFDNTTLAFAYRRFSPGSASESDRLLSAYKIVNPEFVMKRTSLSGDLEQIEQEVDKELEIIRNLVGDRIRSDGTVDPIKEITDPNYYSLKVNNWHEVFEVSLFDRPLDLAPNRPDTLGRHGILGNQVPDIYGVLDLEVFFDVFRSLPRGSLEVSSPKFLNRVNRAHDNSFKYHFANDRVVNANETSSEYLGGIFRDQPTKSKFYYTPEKPERLMGEYEMFIEQLVRSYQNYSILS